MAEYEVYESPKSVSEAKECIDEVIKIILEKYEGEADKEGGEYVAKCWHIVKNNTR